jgi:hypothetical protein
LEGCAKFRIMGSINPVLDPISLMLSIKNTVLWHIHPPLSYSFFSLLPL